MSNVINIGAISTPNPSLWVDTNSLGTASVTYQIASFSPGANWFEVNQFCALLSINWLAARAAGVVKSPYGIANFDADAQKAMAAQLIAFNGTGDGMKAQENFAVQQINGAATDKQTIVNGMAPNTKLSYPVSTKVWAGTNAHVIACYVTSATQYEYYDSNSGSITTINRSIFASACTAFVVRSGAATSAT
jgi:hypothetical protein